MGEIKLFKDDQITEVGWRIPDGLTVGQWRERGVMLARLEQSRSWWLGDWWNAGVEWGEGRETCEALGIAYQSAQNCGQVAKAFQFSRRRENLPFSHHAEVCAIDDPAVQDRMLDWCEETIGETGKPRSTRDLREQVRSHLNEQGWTDSERQRREAVRAGESVIANLKTDEHLIRWAQFEGCLERIDRGSRWGNPYEIGKDGEREYVVESYAIYLERKLSLVSDFESLRGRVLGCWCYPESCHGDVLLEHLRK